MKYERSNRRRRATNAERGAPAASSIESSAYVYVFKPSVAAATGIRCVVSFSHQYVGIHLQPGNTRCRFSKVSRQEYRLVMWICCTHVLCTPYLSEFKVPLTRKHPETKPVRSGNVLPFS
ncbi:hypothetical protein VTN02DRAFT_373 [Thermoascus thermophilus]